MRPARHGLWCCLLLLLACIGTVAVAAISDEGKQAIEQLRQRHQSAEAEPARPRMRDLAEQLRKKYEKPESPKISPTPVSAPTKVIEPVPPAAEVEFPAATVDNQAAESPAATETSAYDACGEGDLPAEKYDHVPYPAAPEKKAQAAESFQQKRSPDSDDTGFSGFIVAVLAVITLFSLGSAFAADSGSRGSQPGVLQMIGLLMFMAAIVVGGITMVKFWPFILLLFVGTMFSQSPRNSGSSGCGCGCGLILLLLILGIL